MITKWNGSDDCLYESPERIADDSMNSHSKFVIGLVENYGVESNGVC